jgi:hypothetical protein
MITLTIACDRCQDPAGPDRTRLEADLGPPVKSWPPSPISGKPGVDLCAACAAELLDWLARGDGAFRLAEATHQ